MARMRGSSSVSGLPFVGCWMHQLIISRSSATFCSSTEGIGVVEDAIALLAAAVRTCSARSGRGIMFCAIIQFNPVECPECCQEYEALGAVVETVRAAKPLYKAPYESYAMARAIVGAHRRRVAMWLSSRLPIHRTLPNYPEQPGQGKRYSFVGARLLQYREDDVAYLAGGLTIHSNSHKGLRMITWVHGCGGRGELRHLPRRRR